METAFLALDGKRLGVRRVKALAKVLGVDPQDLGVDPQALVREPARPKPAPAGPRRSLAGIITANVSRLAAAPGLTVAEVETRAGMRRGFLSPVDGSKLGVTGIAAVAGVLGVEAGDLVDDHQPGLAGRPAE